MGPVEFVGPGGFGARRFEVQAVGQSGSVVVMSGNVTAGQRHVSGRGQLQRLPAMFVLVRDETPYSFWSGFAGERNAASTYRKPIEEVI